MNKNAGALWDFAKALQLTPLQSNRSCELILYVVVADCNLPFYMHISASPCAKNTHYNRQYLITNPI